MGTCVLSSCALQSPRSLEALDHGLGILDLGWVQIVEGFGKSLKFVMQQGYFTQKMRGNIGCFTAKLVPRRGLEPPRPYRHQHLKLARLPFRHLGTGVVRGD